jgi:hypothetical protein
VGFELPAVHPTDDGGTEAKGENCVLMGDPEGYVRHVGFSSPVFEVGLWSASASIQLERSWFLIPKGFWFVGDADEALVYC